MELIKQEWTQFRSMDTLIQKAGVSKKDITKLVAKELTDNALDITDDVNIKCEGKKLSIWNGGNGIPVDKIEELFSINRPLVSTKLIKLPTRGALGNGLRVVVGAVESTGGELFVYTNGDKYKVEPQDDGSSKAVYIDHYPINGTMVELSLGEQPFDESWAKDALYYNRGEKYKGKTSAYWYNSESFYEITQAFDGTVFDLVSEFEGCTGTKAGQIARLFEKNYKTKGLSFEDAELLLIKMRSNSKSVKSSRLGNIGEIHGKAYSTLDGTFTLPSFKGKVDAEIPFTTEVIISSSNDSAVRLLINKSPAIKSLYLFKEKKYIEFLGMGINTNARCVDVDIAININSPVIPITSDGKEPDLTMMKNIIEKAIEIAVQRHKKNCKRISIDEDTSLSQKDIVLAHLDECIAKASGNGTIRFSERQLYYVVRPYVFDELGKELTYEYFGNIITNYETEHGDINGIYRDSRGSLYTPHTKETIPMGTLTVEKYKRPKYVFNKILYIEKEGLFEILKDVSFPERFDCALLTAKGYASRAVKDLLDLLGESDEVLEVYCIHDSDKAGTMIYQTLVESTKSRGARKVKIINLGLDPMEAMAMGLPTETVKANKNASANYLDSYSKNWLQINRVELNAMTSPQFVEWLEGKFREHGACGKIVPNEEVLEKQLHENIQLLVEDKIRDEILTTHGYAEKVQQYIDEVSDTIKSNNISSTVIEHLEKHNANLWKEPIRVMAEDVITSY